MDHNAYREVAKTMNFITDRMKTVRFYGLETEVIMWALRAMKQDNTLTIEQALETGCSEWNIGNEPVDDREPEHTLGVELT